MKGKQSRLRSFLKAALIIFLALIVLVPLAVYSIMAMGFPPIVGNLAAAQVIRKYAAQVYPEWEPEGIWAGYNLVDDGYYLNFSDGEETYTLGSAWPEDRVKDTAREEELLAQAEVERAIRINGLWIPDQLTTSCTVRWASKEPDTPLISVTCRFYTEPELAEAIVREQIADVGMKAYEALSDVVTINRISIHCGQQDIERGISWTVLNLDLGKDVSVTRDLLLTVPVTIKEFSIRGQKKKHLQNRCFFFCLVRIV